MTTTLLARATAATHAPIVRMANQIAVALLSARDPTAATAEHIKTFWEPRMRAQLRTALAGGDGLHPVARAAALRLEPSL
jgi:formate dehydrogenase subunit delta